LIDSNVEWANNTKEMIDAEGGISEIIEADVTSEESCRKAVAKTVELFGTVHILVNVGMLSCYSDRYLSILMRVASRCRWCNW
jgi:NAD(P)-dependent dehydrogenase (short-subunit alcohol dehydrogenase family)